jgi:hypothetical protein
MSRITQKGQGGPLSLVANGAFQVSTDASLETLVGTRWDLSDGREVMLVQAGGSNIVAGVLTQDAAIIANHQGLDITAIQTYSANGNVPYKITATLGGTAVTANQYAGGFAVINVGTGKGQTLRIASHPAQSNGSGSVVLTLEEAPTTALSTSDSEVSLIPAHGNGIVITPTTLTNCPAGVTLYALTAGDYGYVVTKGIVSCLSDAAAPAASGVAVSPSNATSGAVESGVVAQGIVGNAVQAGVSAENFAIFINV